MNRTVTTTPMDLGDIVSAAWFLCVRRWQPLLCMALASALASLGVYAGLLSLVQRAPAQAGPTAGNQPLPLALAPLLIAGILLDRFNQLALMGYSLVTWTGREASVLRCYVQAVRVFWPVLLTLVISGLTMVAGIFSLFGIPVAVYFLVGWFFTGQVCLAEGPCGPIQALKRSRSLVRGIWWRTAAVLAGITLLGFLPSLLVSQLTSSTTLRALFLSALAAAVAAPFSAAAQTILYLDLRIRKHEPFTGAPGEPAKPV
ncbi:MAG: hypothetical protein ACR2PL_00205 [Dehalococcoidia bacterium]